MVRKTFYIETYGCQMNKNDSELLSLSFTDHGFTQTDDPGEAGVAVFNTCSVRQHAEDRALARIRIIRERIKKNRGLIVVAGCMAQLRGEELVREGLADLVVGPYQVPRIGALVELRLRGEDRSGYLSQEGEDFAGRIDTRLRGDRAGASWHQWVTITHGCENYCSYCIVPTVRGALISFPSETIIEYIRMLAGQGVREVTLLGQNVNQYGTDNDDIPFSRLLARAAEVTGLERVNFITSHPRDFNEEIVRVIADHENISRSIHLPLQSGSDRILDRMNRHYTYAHYAGLAEMTERILGTHSLTTDLIVGFPGETVEDFQATLRAVREIRFDDAFTYAYSPRRGTPAANIPEKLSREEKIARLQELITVQREISREKLAARISEVERTIVERTSKRSASEVMGRTFLNHPVVTEGSEADIGKLINIKIESLRGSTLLGARVD